jgi:pimeloyl-ACP methyl ester carboxylesterase
MLMMLNIQKLQHNARTRVIDTFTIVLRFIIVLLAAISAASFDNRVRVSIVIQNYRWRLGVAEGEAKYDIFKKRLAESPAINVPSLTLEGDANGAPHPDASSYTNKFSNKYSHRIIHGGIGHNMPQEAPQAFAEAAVEVDGY